MKKLILFFSGAVLFAFTGMAQEEQKPAISPVKNISSEPVQVKVQEMNRPVTKTPPSNQRRTTTEIILPADTAVTKNSDGKMIPASGRNESVLKEEKH